jgi:hypothetical protein
VKQLVLLASAFLCTATAAYAQTEGRVGVGASVTVNNTTDDDVDSAVSVGPLIRLNPRKGWGPAGALNWYRADLQSPAGGDQQFAELRVRPLMAGVSYTIGSGAVLTSFSIVAGPSFNRVEFDEDVVRIPEASIDVENSFAVRPGVGVTWTVRPRVAIVGFGGYMINRPDITYNNGTGNVFTDEWNADSVVLSVGAVYSIF